MTAPFELSVWNECCDWNYLLQRIPYNILNIIIRISFCNRKVSILLYKITILRKDRWSVPVSESVAFWERWVIQIQREEGRSGTSRHEVLFRWAGSWGYLIWNSKGRTAWELRWSEEFSIEDLIHTRTINIEFSILRDYIDVILRH